MARELTTERSASRAVLAAVKTLEAELIKQRWHVLGVEAQNAELQAATDRQEIEIQHQRVMNFSLHGDLTDVRTALAQERAKPYWRRLLNR